MTAIPPNSPLLLHRAARSVARRFTAFACIALAPVHLLAALSYLKALGVEAGAPRLRNAAARTALYFIAAAIVLLALAAIGHDLAEPEATYAFWAVLPVAAAPVVQGAWLVRTMVRTFPPPPR